MKKLISTTVIIAVFATLAIGQNPGHTAKGSIKDRVPDYKFSVSNTLLNFANLS